MKKMMKKKQILTTTLTVAVLVGTAISVLALGSYLTNFNSQYDAQYQTAGSKLNSCNLCHPGGNTGQLNPYADAFAASGHIFGSIESADSDSDGYTNIEEIAAGTFPGDPNDFPNAPPPNILAIPTEGTIGTEVVLTGSGFDTKKGKVVIGNAYAKIAKDAWTDTTISFTVKKIIPAGPHDVTIYTQPYGATPPIILPSGFTVMNPELAPLSPSSGSPGTEIAISGAFFSTKKGKVYLEDPSTGKLKKCKVTSWSMDPATGASELRFVVPKLSKNFLTGTYQLVITNKVGTVQKTFTVGP
jgi:hypothetical protein